MNAQIIKGGCSRTEETKKASLNKTHLLVWTVFIIMILVLLYCISTVDILFPYGDEYMFQKVLTGEEPLTFAWLWKPVYVHRTVIVKLIMYGWARLTHLDLKLAAYMMLMIYIYAAWVVLRAIQKERKSSLVTDVTLPITMLCCLQLPNIMAFLQLVFAIPYVLLCYLFSIIWLQKELKPRAVVPLALAIGLIAPHCSAYGLCVGLASFIWLCWYLAIPCGFLTSQKGKRILVVIAFVGMTYFAVMAPWLDVKDYAQRICLEMYKDRYGEPLTLNGRVVNALTFLSLWTGVTMAKKTAVAIVVGSLSLLGITTLVYALYQRYRSDESVRYKVSAVYLIIVVILLADIMIFIGKDSAWFPRYYTLIAPMMIGVYAGLNLLEKQWTRKITRTIMLIVTLTFALCVYKDGITVYRDRQSAYADLMAWIRAGKDPSLLTSPQFPGMKNLVYPDVKVYAENVDKVQNAQLAVFQKLRPLFAFHSKEKLKGWNFNAGMPSLEPMGARQEFMMMLMCGGGTVISPKFLAEHDNIQFSMRGVGENQDDLLGSMLQLEFVDVVSKTVLLTQKLSVKNNVELVNVPITNLRGHWVQIGLKALGASGMRVGISAISLSDIPLQ